MLEKMLNKIMNFSMYFLAFCWVVPLIWLVWTAFRPRELATSFTFSFDFTLENFLIAWNTAPFGQYYVNTLIIVIGILAVQLVTATLAAYAFARMKFRGNNIVFVIILIQLMIQPDVLIYPNYNILNSLGLLDTKIGIMIPYFATAFGIFLLRQTFKSVPYDLEEAAHLDGANLLQRIWHVYVPLGKPTFIAFGLVTVSHHWNNFLWPLVVTNSPENRPLTLGLAVFAQSFESGAQWAEVAAATFMVVFPLLLAFFVFQKQIVDSFMQSGIK